MTGEFYPSVSFITSLNVRENFWRLLQFSMAWRRLKSLLQFYLSKHSLFSSKDLDGKISCGFYHIESQLPWLVHCFSVAKLCPTLCDPMDCSTGGFTVPPEFAQTHVHWVGDAIQSSHPLLLPFPPVFHLSWHHGLFQWVSFSYQVAEVLELQHQSFQWMFRVDFLDLCLLTITVRG